MIHEIGRISNKIEKLFGLQETHGTNYCCINIPERKSLSEKNGKVDFSEFIHFVPEESNTLEYWKKHYKVFQPHGVKIVTVSEYCNIYIKILLCQFIETHKYI